MLTFMQLKVSKSKRKLTQKQRAQIVDIEVARRIVQQMIEETLAEGKGFSSEDLDRIFNNQPVYFDGMGYVPHWFERQYIWRWAQELRERYRNGNKLWIF